MRFEHDGMALWFGTPDAPAPSGDILADAHSEVVVTVGVQPADASNRVYLRFRTNREQAEHTVDLRWWRNDISGKAQYFRARLPVSTFRPGDTVEYTAVCYCAGRQVPSADEA